MLNSMFSRRQFLKGIGSAGLAAIIQNCTSLPSSPENETRSSEESVTPEATLSAATFPPVATLQDPRGPFLPFLQFNHRNIKTNGPNFIVVMCDTLRYDHIGYYGNAQVSTPNIDTFANQSVVFDRVYAGSFPTVPNRADIFTGRYVFAYMGWEDLPQDEVVLAKVLNDAGYTTALIFDTMHLKEPFSLDREFKSWQWIRGQEDDRYRTVPLQPELPASADKFRYGTQVVSQYLRNVSNRVSDADYLVARTIKAAIAWLEENYGQNKFFLHIDSFDPHEPWDPPQHYIDLYNPDYVGQQVIYPAYAPATYLSDNELHHVKALYAAEVTMVDHWLGELFTALESLGALEDTHVILTSDHGILIGEHGYMGKSWDHKGHYESYPFYQELAHLPLMVHAPNIPHHRVTHLVQPADIMPTILDWAQISLPKRVQGKSLTPLISDVEGTLVTSFRDCVVTAKSLKTALSTNPNLLVTDGDWTYIYGGGHTSSALYYLPDDPQQMNNVLYEHRVVACDLHKKLVAFLESIGTAEEYLAPWRYSPC